MRIIADLPMRFVFIDYNQNVQQGIGLQRRRKNDKEMKCESGTELEM